MIVFIFIVLLLALIYLPYYLGWKLSQLSTWEFMEVGSNVLKEWAFGMIAIIYIASVVAAIGVLVSGAWMLSAWLVTLL